MTIFTKLSKDIDDLYLKLSNNNKEIEEIKNRNRISYNMYISEKYLEELNFIINSNIEEIQYQDLVNNSIDTYNSSIIEECDNISTKTDEYSDESFVFKSRK